MGEKRYPYGTLAVLPVGVHQDDRLPGSQRHEPIQDGNDGTRRHQRRNDVIGPMTAAAVAVKPSRVAREQFVEVSDQIPVGTGARLDERYPRRAVRDEYRYEPIAPAAYEGRHPVGDVERAGGTARPYPKGPGIHPG